MISNINETLLNKIREYFRKMEVTAIEKGTQLCYLKRKWKGRKWRSTWILREIWEPSRAGYGANVERKAHVKSKEEGWKSGVCLPPQSSFFMTFEFWFSLKSFYWWVRVCHVPCILATSSIHTCTIGKRYTLFLGVDKLSSLFLFDSFNSMARNQ